MLRPKFDGCEVRVVLEKRLPMRCLTAFSNAGVAMVVAVIIALTSFSDCRADDVFDHVDRLAAAAQAQIGAPGLSAAVARGDRIVWADGYGLADVENAVPARPETVYRIASISKPIAATAVLQLVAAGDVSLEDSIRDYVPSFPEKEAGTVTVRHILTHTSGIRHYKPGEILNMVNFDSLDDAISIFKDDPLKFTPGEKFLYSSYAYNLLAGVVEKASGQPFGEYLGRHVWGPAGMRSTFLEEQGPIVSGRARGYVRNLRSYLQNAPYVDLSIKWAGGGMISTVQDLCRFDIALRRGDLLSEETLREMYEPGTLDNGERTGYGLGWRIETDEEGRTWIYHSGGTTGGGSFLLRCPEEQVAVAMIVNLGGGAGLPDAAFRIAREVIAARTKQ